MRAKNSDHATNLSQVNQRGKAHSPMINAEHRALLTAIIDGLDNWQNN